MPCSNPVNRTVSSSVLTDGPMFLVLFLHLHVKVLTLNGTAFGKYFRLAEVMSVEHGVWGHHGTQFCPCSQETQKEEFT